MSLYSIKNNKIDTIYNIFHRRKILLPVVHVVNITQTLENINILHTENVKGCWLINHACSDEIFAVAFNLIKKQLPDFWIGINYLGSPIDPINFCVESNIKPDALWFDNVGVSDNDSSGGRLIRSKMNEHNLNDVLVFGSICFKYQRQPKSVDITTSTALEICDVITTSGKGTGIDHTEEDLTKFRTMKKICTDNSYLAVASGINETNIHTILNCVDIFMVNTSISKNEIFIREKVRKLVQIINNFEQNWKIEDI